MTTVNRAMTRYEWILLLILSVLWGGSFFFVGVAVEFLPPLTIVALRVSLAAMALLMVLFFTGKKIPFTRQYLLPFMIMGILNNIIPFCLIVWGQTHIGSGLASILNGTTPIFTVVVAHFLTQDEKMTPSRVIGVLIGFLGVVYMIGPALLSGLGDNVFAQAAILAAAISYSFAGIYGRRFKVLGIEPIVTATGQVLASSIVLIPLALIIDHPWQIVGVPLQIWGAILGLSLLSTALAYILYFRILSTAGATNLMLVTLLIPVSAILLGTTILGEHLTMAHFIGMGCIAIGLLAIDGRLVKVVYQKRQPSSTEFPS